MAHLPYTDDDLRAEAARQHHELTTDPDYMGVGEMMEGELIASRDDTQWDELSESDFDKAQRAIDDLLSDAANTSTWAISLGADGLQPENDAALTINAGDKPIARVLFAFAPDVDEDMRNGLVAGLGEAIDQHL